MLAHRWQRAHPFPHIVMQNAMAPEACGRIVEALDDEPSDRLTSEIYEVMATGPTFETPTLIALHDDLGSASMLDAVATISGKTVTHVKARGYAYAPGHYLLPHADRDSDALRQVAFALYVAVTEPLLGGELELFDCQLELGQILQTEPAGRIVPERGMLVLFDVSERSVHQVREVLSGSRAAVSGWFY